MADIVLNLPLRFFAVLLLIFLGLVVAVVLNLVVTGAIAAEQQIENMTGETGLFTPTVKTVGQWLSYVLPAVLILIAAVIFMYRERY